MDRPEAESDWRQWVAQNTPRLLLFARQKTRSDEDAQDLVQEAVLEALQRDGHGGPPPVPLVFTIIRRRAIDLVRREDRRAGRESASGPVERAWFDSTSEDRELRELVQSALRQLPEMYRETVTLKIWGELTFAEIAQTLEIPANTAASRYRYGLMELRKMMKGVLT